MTNNSKRKRIGGAMQIHCNEVLKRLCYQADKTHYYIGILYCTKCKKQFRSTLEEVS